MAIMNSRPLVPISFDAEIPEMLSAVPGSELGRLLLEKVDTGVPGNS